MRSIRRESSYDEQVAFGPEIADDQTDLPEANQIQAEQLELLEQALTKLPQVLRQLLQWKFEQGLTYADIGKNVDRSEDAVRMLVHRCMAKIRTEVFPNESQM